MAYSPHAIGVAFPCHAMLCHAMAYSPHATGVGFPCYTMLYHAIPWHAMAWGCLGRLTGTGKFGKEWDGRF